MAKHPRLFKRGGKWTFRARVPDDLRSVLGKKEIWKSLGDVAHAEAVRLARKEGVRADELFAAARARLKPLVAAELTDRQLEEVARSVLYELESAAPPVPFDEREREERHAAALEDAASFGQSIQDASVQHVAMAVADKERLGIDQTSRSFPRLVEAVQRAFIEHYLRDADRAALVPERTADPLFAGVHKGAPAPAKALTLARAVELYVGDVERQHVAPKTRLAYEFKFSALKELLGADRALNEITRADVRDVRDVLLRLPPNATKRFPGIPLREVAETAVAKGIPPMSPKSVTMYVEAISSLFRWLVKEELADRNPAEGLRGPKVDEETDRRPFTIDELNALFAAPAFSAKNGKGWQYWAPRIALFTGARFSEILGLKAVDIVEEEGVPLLRIDPNDIRDLKTKTSRRLVPVHPELVRLGLLDYAKALPRDGLLFPDINGPKDPIRARNQQMGRALRAVIADKRIVFHSFRHTFKDAAERAGISREHIAAIGGWDMPGGKAAMDGYGRAKHAARLAAAITTIAYVNLAI